MSAIVFIVPGSLHTLTGGSIYDRRMVEGLRARGWTVDVREAASPGEASVVLGSLPDRGSVIVDGLLFSEMADAAARARSRLRLIALVHLPRAQEPGLDPALAARLEAGERRALATASLVIATGRGSVDVLEQYGVARDRIAAIEPGTDPAAPARGSGSAIPHLLCVATLNAGKGHEILLGALVANRMHAWRLTCVGSLRRSPGTVDRIRAAIRRAEIDDRVTLTGELGAADLAAQYDRADAFVLPTLRETYGMAVAEARARGLPVISTRTGAIPALVAADAGMLVEPGDARAFTEALTMFLNDTALRDRLRAGARAAMKGLRTWDVAAKEMDERLALALADSA